MSLQRHYNQLKEELAKMRPPKELEEEEEEEEEEGKEAGAGQAAGPHSPQPGTSSSLADAPPLPPASVAPAPWFPLEKTPVKHVLNGPKSAPLLVAALENDLEEKEQSSSSESTSTDQSMSSSTEEYHATIKC